jgi:hypothetical protein
MGIGELTPKPLEMCTSCGERHHNSTPCREFVDPLIRIDHLEREISAFRYHLNHLARGEESEEITIGAGFTPIKHCRMCCEHFGGIFDE